MGNLSILTPLCVTAVLFLLFIYKKVFKVSIPKAYSKSEKDRALNSLAIALLLARDKQLSPGKKDPESAKMFEYINHLVGELEESTNYLNSQYRNIEPEEAAQLNWDYLTSKIKSPLQKSSIDGREIELESVQLNENGPQTRKILNALSKKTKIYLKDSIFKPFSINDVMGRKSLEDYSLSDGSIFVDYVQILENMKQLRNQLIDLKKRHFPSPSESSDQQSLAGEDSEILYWSYLSKTSSLVYFDLVAFESNNSVDKGLKKMFYSVLLEIMQLDASLFFHINDLTKQITRCSFYTIGNSTLSIQEIAQKLECLSSNHWLFLQ